jgi:transglutaminase-like putative cysteine protease
MNALLASVARHPVIAWASGSVKDAGDLVGDRLVRSVEFDSPEDKAKWLDAMCTLDARLPLTREMARRFALSRTQDPNNPMALARTLHRWVRDSIKYVRDPAAEEMSDSDIIIRQGYGDCDDKARLFCALCRSLQIPAKIRPCFDGPDFVHVQAEVKDGEKWIVAEFIVRDLEMGRLPKRGKQVLQ